MPVSSSVYRDPDLQHICAWGELSREDVRRQFAEGPDVPGFYSGIPTLIDLTRLLASNLELPDMMGLRDRLAERHRSHGTTFRAAVLVRSDIAFGMARIFETLCSDLEMIEVEIFWNHQDALAYLDLAGTPLEETLFNTGAIRSA